MLFENPSSYLAFDGAEMTEWEFLSAMAKRTGCGLLLDVNNVYVSATNHGFDPRQFIAGIPFEHVRQIHLAGHSQGAELLIDTHDSPVSEAVWKLYSQVMGLAGPVATMIERDDDIPPLADLMLELSTARSLGALRASYKQMEAA
jgi:uncharacterized protein (UPF0276 family)